MKQQELAITTSSEVDSLTVKFFGVRGSVPIFNRNSTKYGGNTTCLHIKSPCIPEGEEVIIDSGSGIVPLAGEVLQSGIPKKVHILYTHFHHDHTLGLFLCPFLFMKQIALKLYGPIDSTKVGPIEMVKHMMQPPFFPVHYEKCMSHIDGTNFKFPSSNVILFHRKGGVRVMRIDEFERIEAGNKQIPFSKGKFSLDECLQVNMLKSDHPEQTISYRFYERPTGKVFVLLTDHENQDGIPLDLRAHLSKADLIALDCQYTRDKYNKQCAGFGHATPDYCARIAREVKTKALALLHHDPFSQDSDVNAILNSAIDELFDLDIVVTALADYDEVRV